MNKVKIIIFGTSLGAERIMEIIDLNKVSVVGYLDNNQSIQGSYFNGIEIIAPEKLHHYAYDLIVLGSASYQEEMKNQLKALKVEESEIIDLLRRKSSAKQVIKKNYDENLILKSIVQDSHFQSFFNDYGISTMHQKEIGRNITLSNYPDYILKGIDYVRVSTIELLSREIKERNIKGAVAELGVYKGDFSKLISDLFPDRKLYLFDTFEGFSMEDVNVEQKNNFSKAKTGHLGDTNIKLVINKIANKENIVVKKGYFPETTEGLAEEKFAFVSIDVDLYKPTYKGLCYFYNRLSKGGYIIIHDYNFDFYKGVKEAVHDFSEKYGVSFIPVSDYHGSAIITK